MKRKFVCGKKLTAVALSLVLAASPAMSASPVFADEAGEQKTVEASLENGSESKDDNAEDGAGVNKEEKTEDNKLSTGSDENKDKSENEQGEVKEEKKTEEAKTENSKTENSKDEVKAEGSELEKKEEIKENSDAKKTEDKTEGEDAEKKAEENATGVKAEEADLEAVMQKLSKLIESLPSVDEIKTYGNDSEKLAKVNSILNDIAELTENNGIELTDEQTEILTAVADAVNGASAMTLDAQETISGEVKVTSDIEISQDTTASLTIPSGNNVTLTIDEGAILTNVAGKDTITVQSGGTLNIIGGGTIDNTSHARAALHNEGTVNVEDAEFERSEEKGTYSPYSNGGNSYYTVYNKGTLTVEDGCFENNGGFSSMLCNEGKLHIKDGEFHGGVNTIKNEGTLTIEDGIFDNSAQAVILNWNEITINGGTFEPNDPGYASVMNGSWDDEGIVNINGGEFAGSIIGYGYYGTSRNCNGKFININNGHFWDYIEAAEDVSLSITGGEFETDAYISVKHNAKKINISAEPEQTGKSFIGWFDADSNAYIGNVPATDAKYKPIYIENKVTSNSTADVPSENAADTTVSDAVAEIIKNNGSGTSDVEIKTDESDLGSKIKSAIASGKPIGTQMDLSSVSEASLPEAELKAIKELAGNGTLALFTDISIGMTIEGITVANITKLPGKIDITMDIPVALQSGNRSFSVIRMHNGKAELLPATVIAGGTKVSFQTDRFSTYALIYSDIPNGESVTRNSERTRSTANDGTWLQDNNGWWFRETDGSYPKDQWFECTWNGTDSWYHFNANGYADCGWFTDKDGQRYFLHDQHDGKFGFMYTGWNQISGQWYYFNTVTKAGASAIASKGSLVTNGMTPDGYKVDANGAWVK